MRYPFRSWAAHTIKDLFLFCRFNCYLLRLIVARSGSLGLRFQVEYSRFLGSTSQGYQFMLTGHHRLSIPCTPQHQHTAWLPPTFHRQSSPIPSAYPNQPSRWFLLTIHYPQILSSLFRFQQLICFHHIQTKYSHQSSQ